MVSSAVEVRGLSYAYGSHPALREADLHVPSESLFGLLGPNGGGKTTLFRVLSTLVRPSAGRAAVLGFDTVEQPAMVRRRIGVIFQEPALDDELTVVENVRVHAALFSLDRTTFGRRFPELMGLFGLEGREKEKVGTLSGGLKRRVDLVRALLHAPPLLLLDEPTTGLDPSARHTFWELITRLRRRDKTTVIVATHLMDEADRCDGLAIIDGGSIVAQGAPEALKADLGKETLWLEAQDPWTLHRKIEAHFSVSSKIIGSRVQISHPNAHSLLPSLYDHYGTEITSATVRRPTLEDVFMVHTGYGIADGVREPAEVGE